MGTQFTPHGIPRNIIIIMKFLLIGFTLVAVAAAVPIELTPEVATATKEHLAAHAAALKGEHAALAPVQGAAFYLADTAEVAAAKPYLTDAADVAVAKPYLADTADVAAAKAEFQKYFDVAAPVVSYTLPHTYYAGYHPYHYGAYPYHYAAYPYFTGLPVVSAPVVAAKEAVAEE